jgi:uncharacterized YccA/Bax inhibitor family protein
MNTSNKIIIILFSLAIIIAAVRFIYDYQRTERQYQACLEKCEADYCGFASVLKDKNESCLGCKAECKERYGK